MPKNQNGSIDFTVIFAVLLVVAIGYFAYTRVGDSDTNSNLAPPTISAESNEKPFVFTAAGDFSSNENASGVLAGISKADSDFTLALGDLGYGGNGTEPAWCDFVKTHIGNEHPFQLIAGNHDDGTKDGNITEYSKCLPNKMSGLVGEYGIEYYFDQGKLARFIMISPDVNNYGYDYGDGTEHLQWVKDSVNDARTNGIEWIVLGMHKNCITPGIKECEIGDDLLNTALELRIDLVLQGHEHAYFRSKQLALNSTTCPAIVINEYNETCISKAGNELKKGEGTIIVISGAGGAELREVNVEDKEYDYFEKVNGINIGNTYGFSLFNVTKNKLDVSFVPSSGNFTDSFTIK